MRWLAPAVLALAAVNASALPVGFSDARPLGAKEPPADALLVDDEGDVETVVADHAVPPLVAAYIDLRWLLVTEDARAFVFEVALDRLPECATACPEAAAEYRVSLARGFFRYTVAAQFGSDGSWSGTLWAHEVYYDRDVAALEVRVAENIVIEVPRQLLLDHAGAVPRRGDLLADIAVEAVARPQAGQIGTPMVESRDTMGVQAPADRLVESGGGGGTDGFLLTSPAPWRASNGAQTRYRFELELTSPVDDQAAMRVEGLPAKWVAHVQENISLAAGTPTPLELLLETPSLHEHGVDVPFRLVAQARHGHGWVELGIRFLPTPQPSGHHPVLWLHPADHGQPGQTFATAFGGQLGSLWMNALEEESNSTDGAVPGATGAAPGTTTMWLVCLRPDLLVPLRFDGEGTGALDVPVVASVPQDVTIRARLLHLGPGLSPGCYPDVEHSRSETLLMETDVVQASLGQAATRVLMPLRLAGPEEVPFRPGASLVLEVEARHQVPQRAGLAHLAIAPGGFLHLPLLEPMEFTDAPEPAPMPEDKVEDVQSPMVPGVMAFLSIAASLASGQKRRRAAQRVEGR